MARYRKLPVEIEAVQLGWDTWNELCDWIGNDLPGARGVWVAPNAEWTDVPNMTYRIGFLIPTLEGEMLAIEDDYVIRGVNGEYYPCKPDIFAKTYEAV